MRQCETEGRRRPKEAVSGIPCAKIASVCDTYRKFASDDATWVRDRVCEEWLYEGDKTTLVSYAQTLYGDDATVNGLCTVGRGWPRATKAIRQPAGAQDPDQSSKTIELSRRSYDSFGNPTSIYANGVTRNLSYVPDTREFQ